MDPASIVGLFEFGLSCAGAISKVISDINGGAEDVRKLINRIETTVLMVKQLDRVIDENKRTKKFDTFGIGLAKSPREECEHILTKLRPLLVKSGATVTANIKPGQFYKIRAADIERSTFRKANWARHKREFDEVINELERVEISISIALAVYSIPVASDADDKEKGWRELVELFQYLTDSGKTLEGVLPQSLDSKSLAGQVPEAQDTETRRNKSRLLGKIFASPNAKTNESHSGKGDSGNDNLEPDTSESETSQSDSSDSESSGSESSDSESLGYTDSDSSELQISRMSSARSSIRGSATAQPQVLKESESDSSWYRLLRSMLQQELGRSRDQPSPKRFNSDSIPWILHDQDRPDGVALTRSFLLSKTESGAWTSRDWEYPYGELLRRLKRRGVVQEALRAFEGLPQPCKDLMTKISEDDTKNFYWTTLLIDPISNGKKPLAARLFRRETPQTNNISSVLAVLKRCKQVGSQDRELKTAVQELGALISKEIRTQVDDARTPIVIRDTGNTALTKEIYDKTLAEDKAAEEEALADGQALAEVDDEVEEVEESEAKVDDEVEEEEESEAKVTDGDDALKERLVGENAEQANETAKAAESAAEEKKRSDEEHIRQLEAIITESRDNQKVGEDNMLQKSREEDESKAEDSTRPREEAETNLADRQMPTNEGVKAPIKLQDPIGRKFSFPWHRCKSWKDMEELIKSAFVRTDGLGRRVHDGHYHLVGPDDEIILPLVWEDVVQPGWAITMHMWPMEESVPPPVEPRTPMAEKSKENDLPEINSGEPLQQPQKIPTYPKIHKNDLEIATLTYFGLPWQYDKTDSNYIIVLKSMHHDETDVLFEHTKALRQRTTLRIEERPKNMARPELVRTRYSAVRHIGKSKKPNAPLPAEDLARMAMRAYTGLEDLVPGGSEDKTEKEVYF